MNPFLLVVLAYLVGSVPTSHWVGRVFYGIDLRERGSGNLGATNSLRVLGWRAAVPVLAVDVGKGFVPVWVLPRLDVPEAVGSWAMAYGAAAIVGHVFSVWVGFRGGKGVATSGGVLLGLTPWAALAAVVAWILVVGSTRIASLASIVAALVVPLAVWLPPRPGGPGLTLFTTALAAFVIWAHRSNIRRLLRGEENRFSRGGGAG